MLFKEQKSSVVCLSFWKMCAVDNPVIYALFLDTRKIFLFFSLLGLLKFKKIYHLHLQYGQRKRM